MNSIFWKNKKVFLTGHTGFKGSWMSIWIDILGANVKGYALKPEKISLYNQVNPLLKNHSSVIADVRDKKKIKIELLKFQPDIIFHFAAQPLVRKSYAIPVETFEVNAIGTANLLNAVRFLKKECAVVIITTDKVYENPETGIPFSENDKLGGHDPYSASKAAAEIVAESFRLSFFHPSKFKQHKKSIATARAGNVIGGGDYAEDRIIPDIFRALSKSKTISVRNPNAVRPWQHVLEPLGGYLLLVEKMKNNPQNFSSAFNFGPEINDELKVEDLVKLAIEKWGNGKYKIQEQKNASHEAALLKLNIEKSKTELNWSPKWSAPQAIERTIKWYHNSLQKSNDKFELCLKDINDYVRQ